MRQRALFILIGGLLSVAAWASAQTIVGQPSDTGQTTIVERANGQQLSTHADRVSVSADGQEMTMTGHVVVDINGLSVLADRVVIKDGEYRLDGNVRLKAPGR